MQAAALLVVTGGGFWGSFVVTSRWCFQVIVWCHLGGVFGLFCGAILRCYSCNLRWFSILFWGSFVVLFRWYFRVLLWCHFKVFQLLFEMIFFPVLRVIHVWFFLVIWDGFWLWIWCCSFISGYIGSLGG